MSQHCSNMVENGMSCYEMAKANGRCLDLSVTECEDYHEIDDNGFYLGALFLARGCPKMSGCTFCPEIDVIGQVKFAYFLNIRLFGKAARCLIEHNFFIV